MKKLFTSHLFPLKTFVTLVVILSVVLSLGSLFGLADSTFQWRGLRVTDSILVKMTQIFTFAAVGLLLLRTLWQFVNKLKVPFAGVLRKVWAFFHARHILFGWIVTAAAVGHSIYFLIFLPRSMNSVYSGLIALAVMFILVLIGIYFDKKARSNQLIRKVHTVLGIFFFVGLLYHMNTSHDGTHFHPVSHIAK